MEQSGTAKCLPGQVLLNWLTAAADGHGGISSIDPVGPSGLVDTYRITLADTTTYDFAVTNGRGIKSWDKTGTSGLVDTYTMTLDDETTISYTVKNGEKGDKGDNVYTWVKYASQEPTEASHSMGDVPDDWRGEYNGPLAEAPTDWKQYKWYKIKGDKGDTGAPATLISTEIVYQSSDSGTIIPSGEWSASIPVVAQGKYLWKRTTRKFNSGDPEVSYDVNRMGIDGSGSVSSVAGVSPDETGNVRLAAANVGALAVSGGDLTGELRMNGQPITGLNDPVGEMEAARKGYVDAAKTAANAYTDAAVRKAAPRNLLDNSDFRNPVNQRGRDSYTGIEYTIDRWLKESSSVVTLTGNGIRIDNTANHAAEVLIQKTDGKTANYLLGKRITLAIKTADGIYCSSGTVSADNQVAEVYGGTWNLALKFFTEMSSYHVARLIVNPGAIVSVEWIALYEGEYTTETLPEYQPKGYGAELAECQRYYQKYTGKWMSIITNSSGQALFSLLLRCPMRTNPSANYSNNTLANFDVFGEGLKQLLYEYVVTDTKKVYLSIKATDYPNKWIATAHDIELSADL